MSIPALVFVRNYAHFSKKWTNCTWREPHMCVYNTVESPVFSRSVSRNYDRDCRFALGCGLLTRIFAQSRNPGYFLASRVHTFNPEFRPMLLWNPESRLSNEANPGSRNDPVFSVISTLITRTSRQLEEIFVSPQIISKRGNYNLVLLKRKFPRRLQILEITTTWK